MTASGKTHVDLLSKEMEKIIQDNPSLKYLEDKKKIKCELSGHEMPCRLEAVQTYLNGKKFKKLQIKQAFSYDKYKQHIVPSKTKGREHQLFCLLTFRHLNNKPEHIKQHIKGKRFKRDLQRWEECQKTGEKFKPLGGRKKRQFSDSDQWSDREADFSDNEPASDVDSLSDLYPDKDFADEIEDDAGSGSDSEFEEMENDEPTNTKNDKIQKDKGKKRKNKETKKTEKKTKKKKT